MNFSFYLEGKHMGNATRAPLPNCSLENYTYFCPRCGSVWARILCNESDSLRHFALHRECSDCGLGTLRHPFDRGGSLPSLPRRLLERELELAAVNPDTYWSFGIC